MRLPTFTQPHDEPDSPFYCSPGKTPEETWAEILRGQEATLAHVATATQGGIPIVVQPLHLGGWHHSIFRSTFPADAGRFRSRLPNGDPEEVFFGVRVGTARTQRMRMVKGAHPNRIYENLARATLEFNEAQRSFRSGEATTTLRDATIAAGRLYAKCCLVHPFIDGNLRASFCALQAALRSLELPMVEFPDYEEHCDALDTALRIDSNQSYEPLGRLIEGFLRSAA